MRHVWLVALLLVGCMSASEDAAPDGQGVAVGEPNGPSAPDGNMTMAAWHTGSATVRITNAQAGGDEASTGVTNCVALAVSGPVSIMGGNITATWTAQGPANEELQIRTAVRNGVHRGAADYQTSPATLALPAIDEWDDLPFTIGMFLPDPGAAADLSIRIEYEIQATGDFAVDTSFSDCDI